jgi:ABC-type multidrug transport system fused ATPase/permease subunit
MWPHGQVSVYYSFIIILIAKSATSYFFPYRKEFSPCLILAYYSSGKSSTLLALLRLIELQSGAIYIDDIDLTVIPRQVIRTLIATLPQDPVIVPGSIRTNLDPFNRHTGANADEDLAVALRKVRLWDFVQEKGGLDSDFASASLSAGQKQLFGIARCLLCRANLVLLDEVTSSVDEATEGIIREVLKLEFADSTVVEVLHRLDSILDYDEVVVMRDGTVAEVGRPENLLGTDSLFREVWNVRHTTHQ